MTNEREHALNGYYTCPACRSIRPKDSFLSPGTCHTTCHLCREHTTASRTAPHGFAEQRLFDVGDSTPVDVYKVNQTQVRGVFDLWRHVHHKNSATVLTITRRSKIEWALSVYGYTTVCAAIRGCLKSDWHMGSNPGGIKYNDLTHILRGADTIERFSELETGGTAETLFLEGE